MPLPPAQRERMGEFVGACASAAPEFRWAGTEQLHFTLRFVGSVERPLVEAVADRLQREPGPGFDMSLGELGTFRRGRLARVVWVGLSEGAAPLGALAGRLEALCRDAGLEPETRAFKAHLTLARARARDGAALPELPALPRVEGWRAAEVILYSSHLGRGGAVHEPIRSIRLASE